MNALWKEFLLRRKAVITAGEVRFEHSPCDARHLLYAIADQGILSVTGSDAEKFLQGQITCDIRCINESTSSLGAICNPKGRVVATFRAVKKNAGYWLIMPTELLDRLKKCLQMYVLRSDVKLADVSAQSAFMGVYGEDLNEPFSSLGKTLPEQTDRTAVAADTVIVKLHSDRERYQIIAASDRAPAIWQQLCESGGFHECGSSFWRRHEILSGIPTVTSETSEEFVPQMLNLDLLGGISLNKGCYTGQEIVARMYYLGRLKRRMFLIRCPAFTKPGTAIFDAENDSRQSIGTVVQVTFAGEPCYALAVLQISHASTKLRLDSPRGEPICVAEQPYPHPGSADNAPGT